MRALAGAFLVVASVVAAITLYSRLGDRTEVLAVNRTVLAGEQITGADLEIVSISSDDHIAFRPASDRSLVIGQYARVRLAADSLLVDDSLQPQPLVDPDRVLMSVEVPAGQVPVGLREQSRVVLIVTPPGGPSDVAPVLVEAVVAAVPRDLAEVVGAGGDSRATVALSVEVPPADVALVGIGRGRQRRRARPVGRVPRRRRRADHGRTGPGRIGMSIVAVCTAPGTAAATTTALLLGAMAPPVPTPLVAECDPSGGDIAAWAGLAPEPGWSTAVAAPQPTWSVIERHAQALPNGPRVITASSRPSQARGRITRAATSFASMLAATPEVLAVADCGRVDSIAPAWVGVAQLSLLLVRQAPTAGATVARVDRAIEVLDVLSAACPRVGVVLIGRTPYPPAEVEAALGMALFATLPEDPAGAALACGGWTIGRGAGRSALAKAAAVLARRAVEAVGDVDAGLVTA